MVSAPDVDRPMEYNVFFYGVESGSLGGDSSRLYYTVVSDHQDNARIIALDPPLNMAAVYNKLWPLCPLFRLRERTLIGLPHRLAWC